MQERLLLLRIRHKKTKTELARHLGITLKSYAYKERGEREFTSDEMFKIRDLFNRRLEDIFLPRDHQNGDVEEGKDCNS